MFEELKLSAMDIYNITFNTSFQNIEEMKLETENKKTSYLNAFEKYNQEFFFYSDANIKNIDSVNSFIYHVKNNEMYDKQKDKWYFLSDINCPNLVVMKNKQKSEQSNEIN